MSIGVVFESRLSDTLYRHAKRVLRHADELSARIVHRWLFGSPSL